MSVSPVSYTAPLHQVQNTPPDKQAHEQKNSPPKKTESTEQPHHQGKTTHNLDITV